MGTYARLLSLLGLVSLLISSLACESGSTHTGKNNDLSRSGGPAQEHQRVVQPVGAPAGKRWARRDFEKLVLGKTQEEIRKILGDPDNVPDDGSDKVRIVWRYSGRTYTPPARDSDLCVDIWFDYSQEPPYSLQPASVVEHSDGTLRRK